MVLKILIVKSSDWLFAIAIATVRFLIGQGGDGDSVSQNSESATLMSQHAMNIGCYTINLGTEQGQRIHRYSTFQWRRRFNIFSLC